MNNIDKPRTTPDIERKLLDRQITKKKTKRLGLTKEQRDEIIDKYFYLVK